MFDTISPAYLKKKILSGHPENGTPHISFFHSLQSLIRLTIAVVTMPTLQPPSSFSVHSDFVLSSETELMAFSLLFFSFPAAVFSYYLCCLGVFHYRSPVRLLMIPGAALLHWSLFLQLLSCFSSCACHLNTNIFLNMTWTSISSNTLLLFYY